MPIKKDPLIPNVGWNETAGRYVNLDTGRFIRREWVRDQLEDVITATNNNLLRYADQVITGDISIAEFQLSMASDIKLLHTASGAAARGGWAQMSQGDWGYVGSQLKIQYGYLNNFAAQIESGEQALDGRLKVRASMYGDAARSTYEQIVRRLEQSKGAVLEARILGVADHCDDCLDEAGKGWKPIGTLRRIGDSICKTRCHCHFEYLTFEQAQERGLL